VLWIADEVLSGAGRTGTWSALEPYAAVPDILTMGKGITSGYVPLSVVLAPRRIVDVLAKGSGSLLHAQTFSHHPVACAAALATLEEIERQALLPRVAAMGTLLHERLTALLNHAHVGDVRGRGLLAGVEFVSDTATRQPFPRAEKIAEKFAQAAFEAGLVVWPNTGHANGVDGDLAMIAPPFIVSESEIDEIVRRFQRALSDTF
jgi:adenosylmethionine-8-amino-7-oxononanoate aminotransferase